MAARLKPNLRMAESTLRKAGSTADAAQQNFQIFCFFNFIFCFFFERGPHGTVVFSGRPYPKPFQHTVEKEQNQDKKNSRTLESCVRPEFPVLRTYRRPSLHMWLGVKGRRQAHRPATSDNRISKATLQDLMCLAPSWEMRVCIKIIILFQ